MTILLNKILIFYNLIAGAMNGQIFMWDLKVAFNSIVSK
jgi:hypothetical protein